MPGTLLAQDAEEVVGGLTADQYFASAVTLSKVYDWEEAHGIELEMPPHVRPRGGARQPGRIGMEDSTRIPGRRRPAVRRRWSAAT